VTDKKDETIEQMKLAIEQLEFKVAYQEDNFEQLNEIVTNQQFTIDRQTQMLKALVDKVKTLQEPNSDNDPGDDVPPHY
jgi:SlyX protein